MVMVFARIQAGGVMVFARIQAEKGDGVCPWKTAPNDTSLWK